MQVRDMAIRIKNGDRTALSRGITLLESSRADHRKMAEELLKKCLPPEKPSFRMCVTGAPGVGKSSFIEVCGLLLAQKGYRTGVLTIDPSSQISKGSILGDKIRMSQLAKHPNAFVRPSPNQQEMGGINSTTHHIIDLLEAARFNFIIIETVGAGQSEYSGKYVADFFVLLVSPGSGDEIQGIKRGVLEIADMIVVTKADGNMKLLAEKTAMIYRQPQSGHNQASVFTCSAADRTGFDPIWNEISRYMSSERLSEKRKESKVFWLNYRWKEAIFQTAKARYIDQVNKLEKQVSDKTLSIEEAVQKVLDLVFTSPPNES